MDSQDGIHERPVVAHDGTLARVERRRLGPAEPEAHREVAVLCGRVHRAGVLRHIQPCIASTPPHPEVGTTHSLIRADTGQCRLTRCQLVRPRCPRRPRAPGMPICPPSRIIVMQSLSTCVASRRIASHGIAASQTPMERDYSDVLAGSARHATAVSSDSGEP